MVALVAEAQCSEAMSATLFAGTGRPDRPDLIVAIGPNGMVGNLEAIGSRPRFPVDPNAHRAAFSKRG